MLTDTEKTAYDSWVAITVLKVLTTTGSKVSGYKKGLNNPIQAFFVFADFASRCCERFQRLLR